MAWNDTIKPFGAVRKIWVSTTGKRLRDLDDETLDTQRLEHDLIHSRRAARREFMDLRHVTKAADHIQKLPEAGETIHAIVGGSYPQMATIPACLKLAGDGINIAELYIVTLSFSRININDLCRLIDDKQIAKVAVIVSHYFAHTSEDIYNPAAKAITDRGHRIAALRSHAKVMLIGLSDGRRITVEGSANLRSCKNIEQFCMTNDPELYAWHRNWIEGLLAQGGNK